MIDIILIILVIMIIIKMDIDKADIKQKVIDSRDVIITKMTTDKLENNESINRVCKDIKMVDDRVKATGKDIDSKIEREIYKIAFTPIQIKKR